MLKTILGVLDWNRTSNWPLGGAGYIHLTTRTAVRILAEMRRNQNLGAGIMRALKEISPEKFMQARINLFVTQLSLSKIVSRSCHLLH